MYWIENLLFIVIFIGFEFMIYPFVWLKSLCNVIFVSMDLGSLYILKHSMIFIL